MGLLREEPQELLILLDDHAVTLTGAQAFASLCVLYLHCPLDNNSAMIQLMAGAGVAIVGTVLIPLLNSLFTT